MTKKKDEKEFMLWRLQEIPSVDGVAKLIDKGVITNEEARQIVFSSQEDRDKKSLQDEIKFLRELVEKLSNNQNSRIVEVIREVEKPAYRKWDWYGPYYTWCGSGGTIMHGTAAGELKAQADDSTIYATPANANFSNIKTF